jgi:RHS repeat-associated protein
MPLAAQALFSRSLGRDDRRYYARFSASGLRLRNPSQGLAVRFSRSGLHVRAGANRLGLALHAYGYGQALRPAAEMQLRAVKNRVSYRRGSLVEWYENGPLGLEQGFTLRARPSAVRSGPLTLALSVSGNLHPSLAFHAAGLVFASRSGPSALRYRGLAAFAAGGRRLPAWLELRGSELLFRVDDAGARYPLTIDPFVQQAKLTASDGAGDDFLGFSVAISGDTIVAGAPGASVAGTAPGAAYVFVEPAEGWGDATQTAKLTASDGATFDSLGTSVAISGGTIVAGAPYAAAGGTTEAGAAYVFVEPANGWADSTQAAKLTASDGVAQDHLGYSVAISGSTIVAGAPGYFAETGAAYVFAEPAGGWADATQTAQLTASDETGLDHLGASVAISGRTIVAGAPQAGSLGAAYVFAEPAAGWADDTETAKLTACDITECDSFGASVAISGSTIVAGAPGGGYFGGPGAAFVFAEGAGGWVSATQTAKLRPSNQQSQSFGSSVAISGGTILSGAPVDSTVYLFAEPTGGWVDATETATLTTSDDSAIGVGNAVAISGSTIVAGTANSYTEGPVPGAVFVFGGGQTAGQPPPIGGPETSTQMPADWNVAQKSSCECQDTGVRSASRIGHIAYPINAASGVFWHTFTDLTIPGRGPALELTRTYSSVFAGRDGPLGHGWTDSYNMSLTTDATTGTVAVHQENGAQVIFTPDSVGNYSAPPRNTATLVKSDDGSFTFTRNAQQTFTFSATGRLTTETDPNGYATVLAYDSSGQLARVTDPAGRSLTFTSSGGHIVGVKDPAGRTVTFTYDLHGDLIAAKDANGGVTKFTYDDKHQLLTMTDPRGGVVTNKYDDQGRVITQSDPLGHATRYVYSGDNGSAAGGTTTITDPKGNTTEEHYQYGLLISLTRGDGTPAAATWSYKYDPATLGVTSETDPNGHTTNKTYDERGNLLTKTDALDHTTMYTWNDLNEQTSVSDALGVTTTNTYDTHGNLRSSATPVGSSSATTTYGYTDSAHSGDLTSTTDPNGHEWTYTYDALGNRTSTTDPAGGKTTSRYNVIGERLATIAPNGNEPGASPGRFTTTYTYDRFGDVLTVTDPLGHRTRNSYDANRNLVKVRDASGNATTNTYDADNEKTKTVRTSAAGQVLQTLTTTYDADGNVLAQINGLGIATETYDYDPLNHVAAMTDALGRTTTYTYDGAGNRLSLVDPSGRATSLSYDAANELIDISYSDGTTPGVTYTYDADGQRTTMSDGTGTTSYSYDELHRLTNDTQGDGETIAYAHDLAGNLTQLTYPDGKTVSRTYDAANRLSSVASWLSEPNTVTFAYDADSNLTKETYPNGVGATFTYDAADRLRSIVDTKGSNTLLNLLYARNADGLVTKESTRSFAYDGLNRLTSDSLAKTAYSYDAADELAKLTASTGTTTFSYDAANELTAATTGAGATTYTYDKQGNRLGATLPGGSPATYTYDQANRLIGFSNSTTTASYGYNGDGLRMSKTANATAEPLAWDIAEGLPLLISDGSTSYVTGPRSLPLERIGVAGSVLFYHQDQLGSTRMLTDSAGAVQAAYTYKAYGALATGSLGQPLGFAGQYTDTESGLIYLRARYFDPTNAHFLTRDPVGDLTREPYAYVTNNPTNETDATGLDGVDVEISLCAVVCIAINSGNGFGIGFGSPGATLSVGPLNTSFEFGASVLAYSNGTVTGSLCVPGACFSKGTGTSPPPQIGYGPFDFPTYSSPVGWHPPTCVPDRPRYAPTPPTPGPYPPQP